MGCKRKQPIFDKYGIFTVAKNGNLVVKNGHGDLMWRTNFSVDTNNNCTASLLDSGNLMIVNSYKKKLWQSFQHPTDTFLPGMRIYMNGILRSWTSESDPSPGR